MKRTLQVTLIALAASLLGSASATRLNAQTTWNAAGNLHGISGAHTSVPQPAFNIVKPSTTGIPGEEVRIMRFDPTGNLWVAGRWPFWGESGVAMLSADQLDNNNPFPGGGFETGAWKVWSSVQHPIPSQYLYDMQFSADGTMWLASEGGLTRFRPNAPNPADRWFTYTPANSPLIISSVISIAIDNNGNVWASNAECKPERRSV